MIKSKRLPLPMGFFHGRMGAWAADAFTFSLLNLIQLRQSRRHVTSPAEIADYAARHGSLSLDEFYALPADAGADEPALPPADAAPVTDPATGLPVAYPVTWRSPHPSGYAANDQARADFYPCRVGWPQAPTVFFLHALMSANDTGYRFWAKQFHARGWNACFVHLPYHYSRRPPGFYKGELAIGSDLLRTAEGLRQAVKEMRQLRGAMRRVGARDFGIWATSYGGWVGGLWSCVEDGFRFVALIQPIIDVADVIWRSPAARAIRRQLRRRGVSLQTPGMSALLRLGSTSLNHPREDARRVLLLAGDYDAAVTPESLRALHERWAGSRFLRGPQGHFGFYLMPEALRQLDAGGYLQAADSPLA